MARVGVGYAASARKHAEARRLSAKRFANLKKDVEDANTTYELQNVPTLSYLRAAQLGDGSYYPTLQNRAVISAKFSQAVESLKWHYRQSGDERRSSGHKLCLLHKNVCLEGLATSRSHAKRAHLNNFVQPMTTPCFNPLITNQNFEWRFSKL